VASRPFDEKRFRLACDSIKESLGEGALMEAIGMAAAIDGSTRCVDISGKDPLPPRMISIMSFVLKSINGMVSCFR